MKTKTKENILSLVKRALRYQEPKQREVISNSPHSINHIKEEKKIIPLACEFLVPAKLSSESRFIKRQLKDLMSNELLKYVKIRKENHPTGAIKVIGLLEVVK